MPIKIDPSKFNLPAGTVLEEGESGEIILVIARKSRIIMADGHRIVAKVEAIRNRKPECRVCLQTTAPVCSKTTSYLAAHNIKVI